jgi:hypothetical protein
MEVAKMFHSALSAKPSIISVTLGDAASRCVAGFMRSSLIARMTFEYQLHKSRNDISAQIWMAFLASYGCIWADIDVLFDEWQQLQFNGLCVAALEFLSLFAYDDRETPLFVSSPSITGDGTPRPWDYAGDDADLPCWLPENVNALARIFTVESIEHWASNAATRLSHHPESELARLVCDDIKLQPYRIQSRITDFIHHMGSSAPYKYWSDSYGISSP